MTRILPVAFVWRQVEIVDGDGVVTKRMVMDPLRRFDNVAKRQYGEDGSEHTMVPLEARSRRSHNHYFAALGDGFDNLPESIAARWPSVEHMRKWLLIETGWFEEKEFDYEGRGALKNAQRMGKFLRTENDYARIRVIDVNPTLAKVIVRTAKSQSAQAMAKQEFDASKKDVLDKLEEMIGIARGTLKREAGMNS